MYALVYYICTYMSMYMYYLEASSKEVGIDWYRYKLVHVQIGIGMSVVPTDLSSSSQRSQSIHQMIEC